MDLSLLSNTIRVPPDHIRTHPYGFSNYAATAFGATEGSNSDSAFPNKLCVTSRPGALIAEKCKYAFQMQQDPVSKCGWEGSYLASIDNVNLPQGGPGTCINTSDVAGAGSNAVCCPKGSKAVYCDSEKFGIDTSLNPRQPGESGIVSSYICVPESEYLHDITQTGDDSCYKRSPSMPGKKTSFDHVRTN